MKTQKNKMGRPPKPPEELRKPRQIRMTDDEWALIKQAAALFDADVASWMRPIMLRAAKRVIDINTPNE